MMVSLDPPTVKAVPLAEAVSRMKSVPLDGILFRPRGTSVSVLRLARFCFYGHIILPLIRGDLFSSCLALSMLAIFSSPWIREVRRGYVNIPFPSREEGSRTDIHSS